MKSIKILCNEKEEEKLDRVQSVIKSELRKKIQTFFLTYCEKVKPKKIQNAGGIDVKEQAAHCSQKTSATTTWHKRRAAVQLRAADPPHTAVSTLSTHQRGLCRTSFEFLHCNY